MSDSTVNVLKVGEQKIRALHLSWFAFFLIFVVWFSHAPLKPLIMETFSMTKEKLFMKALTKKTLLFAFAACIAPTAYSAETINEAFKETNISGNFNFRYENVGDDVGNDELLSLRSRLTFNTGTYNGFSVLAEIEDVTHILGVDGPLPGPFEVDQEVTEVDQIHLQYKNDKVSVKLGRQLMVFDNQRFIGHVGWRQDRQTFDAASIKFQPIKGLNVDLAYLFQRNRIFGEEADARSSDTILNSTYDTPVGKIVGYAYLLDDESRDEQSDTVGLRFTGSRGEKTKLLYTLEYADQSITDSGTDFDTEYLFAEIGGTYSGITGKIGYELLSSDDGGASFTAPLGTLHAFNGWADVFLGGGFNPTALPNGLVDTYLSLAGEIGGVKLTAVYHDFESDEGSDSYGTEWNFLATKSFGSGFSAGLKYADYSDDGFLGSDRDIFWGWVSYAF